MADDTAMGSLLAAVAVAAASSTNSPSNKLPPISLPEHPSSSLPQALPPPPPPLPPPLPSPPPLPPIATRNSQSPLPTVSPSSPLSSDKKKGARIFSANEKTILDANYARNKFPSRLHMETLANAMAKPTDKIRTWYNNRRALDRKLGLDVNRNHLYHPHPPSTHPIILPVPHHSSPPSPTQNQSFHTPSPVSLPRPPSISPVTTPRNSQLPSSPSPPNPPPKSRTSPLRFRNAILRIGSNHICGEIPQKPSADNGLEVKFLFGKKRIVYEWYCGLKYSEAQNTGGPYAKMEMNFTSMAAVHVLPNPPNTLITFSFSAFPTLFLQTHESMTKYRVRAQQRQYRKVTHQEFPIPVSIDQHTISLQPDEATRVLKLLRDETTALSIHMSEKVQPTDCATAAVSPMPQISHIPMKCVEPYFPETTRLADSCATPVTSRAPIRNFGLSSEHLLIDRKSPSALHTRQATDTKTDPQHHDANTTRAVSSQVIRDVSRKDSSYSPVTPATLTAALKGTKLWLTPRVSTFQSTPVHDDSRGNQSCTDNAAGQVRRELNFERTPRHSDSNPRVGEKRFAPATPFDENCANLKTRRKLVDWKSSPGTLPTVLPNQNHDGRTLPPKHDIRDERPPTRRDNSKSSLVDSQSVLRVLPR